MVNINNRTNIIHICYKHWRLYSVFVNKDIWLVNRVIKHTFSLGKFAD